MDGISGIPDPYESVAQWLQGGRATDPPWPIGAPHADAIWDAWWVVHEQDTRGLASRWRVVAPLWPDVLVALVNLATAAVIDKSAMEEVRSAVRAGDFERGLKAFAPRPGTAWRASHHAFYLGLYELLPSPPPLSALAVSPALPPPSPPPDLLLAIIRETRPEADDFAGALARSSAPHFLLEYAKRHKTREAVADLLDAMAREVVDLLDVPDRQILDGDPFVSMERLRSLVDYKLPRGALAAPALAELAVAHRIACADPPKPWQWHASNEVTSAGFLLHEARLHRYLRAHGAELLRGEEVEAPPSRGAVADRIRSLLRATPVTNLDLRSPLPSGQHGVRLERVRVLRYPGIPAGMELTFHRGVNVVPQIGDDDGATALELVSRVLRSDLPRIPGQGLALEFALGTCDAHVRVEVGVEPGWVQMFVEPTREGVERRRIRECLVATTNDRAWATDPGGLSAVLRCTGGATWSRCREVFVLRDGLEAYDLVAGSDLDGRGHAEARVGRAWWGHWEAGRGRLVPRGVERWLVREAVHAPDLRDGPWTSASCVPTLGPLASALGFVSMEIGALPPSQERVDERVWLRFPGFRMRFRRSDGVDVSADDLDESVRSLIGLCWHLAVHDGVLAVAEPLSRLEPRALAALADVVEGRQIFIARMADLHRLGHGRPITPPCRVSITYEGRARDLDDWG
jgi:hypothetical protein